MARDEMENITEDKWNDDIWGVENSTEQQPIPKLYFYFGQNVILVLSSDYLPYDSLL